MRICLIDPEGQRRRMLCEGLSAAGHTVRAAPNVNAGLHLLSSEGHNTLIVAEASATLAVRRSIIPWDRKEQPSLRVLLIGAPGARDPAPDLTLSPDCRMPEVLEALEKLSGTDRD